MLNTKLNVDYLHQMGADLANKGNYVEAIRYFEEVIRLDGQRAGAFADLASIYFSIGENEKALSAIVKAYHLDPISEHVLHNKVSILTRIGRHHEAISIAKKMFQKDPDHPDHLIRYATALFNASYNLKALHLVEKGTSLHPQRSDLRRFLGILYLLFGKLKEGYELFCPHGERKCIYGKKVLIQFLEGYGDAFQLLRYIPLLKKRSRPILELPLAMHDLVRHLEVEVIAKGQKIEHDFSLNASSLPLFFETEIATIPSPLSFPFIKKTPIANRIAFAWRGHPNSDYNWKRSMDILDFAPFFAIPGIEFICLQPNPTPTETEILEKFQIQIPALSSWMDTLHILKTCSLVLSVDTAIVHLAGSLNIPTWVLMHRAPDWRWMLERSDSPWYMSIRLFRQKFLDQWNEPIEEMRQALIFHKQNCS